MPDDPFSKPRPLSPELTAMRDRIKANAKKPLPQGLVDYVVGMMVTSGVNFAFQWVLEKPGRRVECVNRDGENIDVHLYEPDGSEIAIPTEPKETTSDASNT